MPKKTIHEKYSFGELVAAAATADSNGNLALRVEDTAGDGVVPATVVKAIINSASVEDALKYFFSEDANGNIALKLNIDATAIT